VQTALDLADLEDLVDDAGQVDLPIVFKQAIGI
jgi:hypothetical protein